MKSIAGIIVIIGLFIFTGCSTTGDEVTDPNPAAIGMGAGGGEGFATGGLGGPVGGRLPPGP
jgi:hypothetical protein